MSFHDINHCIIINFFPLSKSTIAATSPIFLIVLAPNWTGLATDVFEATKNNLGLATIALGAGGLVAVAAPGVVVAPVIGALHCVGFGTGGIVSGTVAASAQATIGNVVAPGLFATLTSAAAGGYGVAAISGAAQWIGGTMVGLAGTGAWLRTQA